MRHRHESRLILALIGDIGTGMIRWTDSELLVDVNC